MQWQDSREVANIATVPATIKPNQALQKTWSNLFFNHFGGFGDGLCFNADIVESILFWQTCLVCGCEDVWWLYPRNRWAFCDKRNFRSNQCQWHAIKHHFAMFFFGGWCTCNSQLLLQATMTSQAMTNYSCLCRSARASKSSWIFFPQESLQLGFW